MILHYFPIAQNTGPFELRFGSNLSIYRPSIMCDYYRKSLADGHKQLKWVLSQRLIILQLALLIPILLQKHN